MNVLKKQITLLLGLIAIIVGFSACDNSSGVEDAISLESVVEATANQAMAEDEFAAAFEFVSDELINMDVRTAGSANGAQLSAIITAVDTFAGTENIPECAIITRDSAEKTLTIDFGDGCEGRDGVIRSGQILIEVDGDFRELGRTRTITLRDYTSNGTAIEGSMSITFNGNGYTREVNNAQITTDEGTFSFSSTRTVVRTEGSETIRPFDDRYEITGSKEGNTRQEVDFTSKITSPLIKKRGSLRCRRNIAAGIIEFTFGETEAILDYGDGSCDRRATLTINGETREIILR